MRQHTYTSSDLVTLAVGDFNYRPVNPRQSRSSKQLAHMIKEKGSENSLGQKGCAQKVCFVVL